MAAAIPAENAVLRPVLPILRWLGIVGPPFFALVVAIGGVVRPGYDQMADFISTLGASGYEGASLLNTLVFLPLGISTLATASVLLVRRGDRIWGRVGAAFVGAAGFATTALTFIPARTAAERIGAGAVQQTAHQLLAFTAFLLIPLAALAMSRVIERPGLRRYSVAAGVIGLILVLAFVIVGRTPIAGLTQKMLTADVLLWLAAMAATSRPLRSH